MCGYFEIAHKKQKKQKDKNKMLLQDIIDFNRENGCLDFRADHEVVMLSEEANEFFTSDNLVDRIDAVCDFIYVGNGTEAKFYATQYANYEEMKEYINRFSNIKVYLDETKKTMMTTVILEIESNNEHINDNQAHAIINECLACVVEANKQKLNAPKDENGKVQKPKGFIPPEEKIKEILGKHEVKY